MPGKIAAKMAFCFLLGIAVLFAGILQAYADDFKIQKAVSLMDAGKTDDAIIILALEADRDPENFDAYLALGAAYLKKSDFDNARRTLERAASLNGASVMPQYYLALLCEKSRDFSKAKLFWNNVLNLSGDKDLRELAIKHIRNIEKKR